MSKTPPETPHSVAVSDADRLHRINFRLFQIMASASTVLVTCWLFTIGILAGIVGLMVAKHVLVAILVMGMDYGKARSMVG